MTSFEARYRAQADPWDYLTSAYEQDKYAHTLRACGPDPFAHALELGASIGVFSAMLAPRCTRLTTIDGAPTAVAAARARLAEHLGVDARVGTIPADLPDGPFDLVVASEVLYYLDAGALERTLDRLRRTLAPGGRLVAVHYRPGGPERPHSAAAVHAMLRASDWLRPVASERHDRYLLDALHRTGT